jgi:hypothetical protein
MQALPYVLQQVAARCIDPKLIDTRYHLLCVVATSLCRYLPCLLVTAT